MEVEFFDHACPECPAHKLRIALGIDPKRICEGIRRKRTPGELRPIVVHGRGELTLPLPEPSIVPDGDKAIVGVPTHPGRIGALIVVGQGDRVSNLGTLCIKKAGGQGACGLTLPARDDADPRIAIPSAVSPTGRPISILTGTVTGIRPNPR